MFNAILGGFSALSQLGLGVWNQVQTDTRNHEMLKMAQQNLDFQKSAYDDQKKRYNETKDNQQAGFNALGESWGKLESEIPTMRV